MAEIPEDPPSNVIQFKLPGDREKSDVPLTDHQEILKDALEENEKLKQLLVDTFAVRIYPGILAKLTTESIDLNGRPDVLPDVHFLVEAVRSLLCRYFGTNHPLHPWVNGMYSLTPDGKVVKHSEIQFPEPSET